MRDGGGAGQGGALVALRSLLAPLHAQLRNRAAHGTSAVAHPPTPVGILLVTEQRHLDNDATNDDGGYE